MSDRLDKPRSEKALRALIHRLVRRWKVDLWLGVWKIEVTMQSRIDDGSGDGQPVSGMAVTRWPYLEADLEFSVAQLASLSDFEVERVVIHELLHVVVAEMNNGKVTDREERVVSTLSMAVHRLGDMAAASKRAAKKRRRKAA